MTSSRRQPLRKPHGNSAAIKASNPRAIAASILSQVCGDGLSLSPLLDRLDSAQPERPLIQELCYGTLRHYHWLSEIIGLLLTRPLKTKDADVQALLLLGVYQLSTMRIPEHAAVNETVAAADSLNKPWARSLVNGILRNYLRQHEELTAQAMTRDAARWRHPQWLIERLRAAWPAHWQGLLEAGNQRPPLTLRVNQRQTTVADYLAVLHGAGIAATAGQQAPTAVWLHQPVEVQSLPGFAQGQVSVQDEAAQLAASILAPQPGQRVLDVCAAPGGKTAHLLELADIDLVAVDIDAVRLARVAVNLTRLGRAAQLVAGDATRPADWWDGRQFDRILLDAPCSATGVIRRHPDIKVLRRATDIAPLVKLQAQILRSIWPLLKPGGILLYATCSILPEENAEQIQAFVQQQPDARPVAIDASWGYEIPVAQGGGRQILTGAGANNQNYGGMDGFYYACLAKT